MSEKIYACLLRLYPANFRQAHGDDALQLFRDRHDAQLSRYLFFPALSLTTQQTRLTAKCKVPIL